MAAPSNQTGGKYTILDTPNPEEFSFRVLVDATRLKPSDIPRKETPYIDCKFPVKPRFLLDCEYRDYIYTYSKAEGEGVWFHFAKNKTYEERNTPFEVYSDWKEFPWPAILEDLYFVQTTAFPQTVNTGGSTVATAPRIFPRFKHIPQTNVPSEVKVELFLSPIAWPEAELFVNHPIPTSIDGSYLGVSVSFPRCLHQTVVLGEQVPGASVIYGTGVVDPPLDRNPERMIFPATNFEDWASFILSDGQQPTNGVFLRERITIYPPPKPEAIVQ